MVSTKDNTQPEILRGSPLNYFFSLSHFEASIRIRDLRYLELINSIEVVLTLQKLKKVLQ